MVSTKGSFTFNLQAAFFFRWKQIYLFITTVFMENMNWSAIFLEHIVTSVSFIYNDEGNM